MRRSTGSIIAISALLLFSSVPGISSAQANDADQAIINAASARYYNIRTAGLKSFQCRFNPDWGAMLQSARVQNPSGVDAAIVVLSKIYFLTKLNADNTVVTTHNSPDATNQQMENGLRQVYDGANQMLSGFFDTWKSFVTTSPFPGSGVKYQIDRNGEFYIVSYKDGSADVTLTMDPNYVLTDVRVVTSEFNSDIEPKYSATSNGLLLASYHAVYQTGKPEEATNLDVAIGYQDVGGFDLPGTLNLSGSYGGAPFSLSSSFSDCQVTQ